MLVGSPPVSVNEPVPDVGLLMMPLYARQIMRSESKNRSRVTPFRIFSTPGPAGNWIVGSKMLKAFAPNPAAASKVSS
jgi:hypothetical protein